MKTNLDLLEEAAEVIAGADALLIGAGAGMGVDSGLPDYRGTLGYWTSNPEWEDLASGQWFLDDPEKSWLVMREKTAWFARAEPHLGYDALRSMAGRMSRGARVYTSNVDAHFVRAGFHPNAILECHGSMFYLQCASMCSREVWYRSSLDVLVDDTLPIPTCPHCEGIARPNVLLFGDNLWTCSRHVEQMKHYLAWRDALEGARVAVLEIGAGSTIPSVREQCELVTERYDATLIRINPFESECPEGIGIPLGACAALTQLDRMISRRTGNA